MPMQERNRTMVLQTPQTPDDSLFTFKEAMDYLRVSRSTLYRLPGRGAAHRLQGRHIGAAFIAKTCAPALADLLQRALHQDGTDHARHADPV